MTTTEKKTAPALEAEAAEKESNDISPNKLSDSTAQEQFDWVNNDWVIQRETETVAIYPNCFGDVVICEHVEAFPRNHDETIIIGRGNALAAAQAILDAAGFDINLGVRPVRNADQVVEPADDEEAKKRNADRVREWRKRKREGVREEASDEAR